MIDISTDGFHFVFRNSKNSNNLYLFSKSLLRVSLKFVSCLDGNLRTNEDKMNMIGWINFFSKSWSMFCISFLSFCIVLWIVYVCNRSPAHFWFLKWLMLAYEWRFFSLPCKVHFVRFLVWMASHVVKFIFLQKEIIFLSFCRRNFSDVMTCGFHFEKNYFTEDNSSDSHISRRILSFL